MGKVIDWFIDYSKSKNNGKFDWQDLLSPYATINAISGNDKSESAYNGKFDLTDLTSGVAGLVDIGKSAYNAATEQVPEILNQSGNVIGIGDVVGGPSKEGQTNTEQNGSGGASVNISGNISGDGTQGNASVDVSDKTDENIMQLINYDQQQLWERQDQLRKENWEREDTAYQRMVEDMRKAGINPNLWNGATPIATSNTDQSSAKDYSLAQEDLRQTMQLLQEELDRIYKGNEEDQNRLLDLFGKVADLFKLF